jgi:hypothetical protein
MNLVGVIIVGALVIWAIYQTNKDIQGIKWGKK